MKRAFLPQALIGNTDRRGRRVEEKLNEEGAVNYFHHVLSECLRGIRLP